MRACLQLLLISLVLSSCSVRLITSKTYHRYIQQAPYDAIVVPGMQYDSSGQNGLYKARMHWAKMLYDSGVTKNIIFSGAAVYTPYREGSVMKIFADSMGIPAKHTFAETEAMHSNENVYYGFKMARQLGFKKVAIATDPFQSWLFELYIKSYKHDLPRLPLPLTALRNLSKDLPYINPKNAKVKDFEPLKRKGGLLKRVRHSFSARFIKPKEPKTPADKHLIVVQ